MKYLGLARKYRPNTFDEVVGQKEIAETLQNTIRMNRIHHAYLFCGSRGVGKTSMARIFSKALNCEKGPTTDPCCQCEICQKIALGEDVDVIEIDGASNRGIEEIRNIKDNIKYLPARSRFKIFIIDEIHMLTGPAFNALLKTLEEPPEHAKFIFATTQIHSIPDTILSRCQRFHFKKITNNDIVDHLAFIAEKEKLKVSREVLQAISLHTSGALRDSLVLLDQLACFNESGITMEAFEKIAGNAGNESLQLIEGIIKKDCKSVLQIVQDFFGRGGNPAILIDEIIQKYRDLLVLIVTNEADFIEGTEQYNEWLLQNKTSVSQDFLYSAIHHLLKAKTLMQRSLLGRIVLETTLLKIVHIDSFLSIKEIEKNINSLQEKLEGQTGSRSMIKENPRMGTMQPYSSTPSYSPDRSYTPAPSYTPVPSRISTQSSTTAPVSKVSTTSSAPASKVSTTSSAPASKVSTTSSEHILQTTPKNFSNVTSHATTDPPSQPIHKSNMPKMSNHPIVQKAIEMFSAHLV